MTQKPMIRDGVVVNVVALDDDTLCVTKAEHKKMQAAEDADYEQQLDAWRKVVGARNAALNDLRQKAFMSNGILMALKIQAEAEKAVPKQRQLAPSYYADRIKAAESELKAQNDAIAKLEAEPAPAKPKLIRTKRWFYPDDVVIGPAGGNIGDAFDGRKFTRPAKDAQ